MGELKYRIDLAKDAGIEVKVAKGNMPEKGIYNRTEIEYNIRSSYMLYICQTNEIYAINK